jgi:uncharacterized protein (DUF1810 family)
MDVSRLIGCGSFFPQLTGLGHSAMAQRYAIRDLEQAKRYLADPTRRAAMDSKQAT